MEEKQSEVLLQTKYNNLLEEIKQKDKIINEKNNYIKILEQDKVYKKFLKKKNYFINIYIYIHITFLYLIFQYIFFKIKKELLQKQFVSNQQSLSVCFNKNQINKQIIIYIIQKAYKQKVQKIIGQQLLNVEKLRREELKTNISIQKQRLGEYIQVRECTKFDESWQDGSDFQKINERLAQIEQSKEELEKCKKALKINKKQQTEYDLSQIEQKQRINLQLQCLTKVLYIYIIYIFIFFIKRKNKIYVKIFNFLNIKKYYLYKNKKDFMKNKSNKIKKQENIIKISSRYGKLWPCLGERYQLLSLLGRGGFSEVYKAYDLIELREVACKIHQLNLNWSERSKANYIKHAVRESKIHSELKHPNIVQLYDTVEIDENSFATVLEFCEGPDLYFYLKKYRVIAEKEAKLLIKQILNALKYMSSQKMRIIHYDLKPQNIIFHKGELKITDFGLCKIIEDEQTKMELTSQGVGTYWYLPPETFEFENNPQISQKVDIWSVGVIFFEMIFGQRPFGNNMSQDKILKDNIILKSTQVIFPQKPSVSNECKDFIKSCLTYDQNNRWDIQQAINSSYLNKK
ncbi:protein kinase domain protein [Ichthyophthirius multifiliis]|uniref:Protein kinase domain protein n=1 Tax=Ichthyophthirius multifiliis TaxID=5932 RepID=G0QXH4_ICHMU|nr:protein kinase domain protein [Ichthyophthirius multifiliis]EGR30092.1 protein kinase domain protein [Ichthyophthirius multifiliis]|eukprot:XP_004031328.1 protein kinase domain protein [Ichthyophthirius multifiliis]